MNDITPPPARTQTLPEFPPLGPPPAPTPPPSNASRYVTGAVVVAGIVAIAICARSGMSKDMLTVVAGLIVTIAGAMRSFAQGSPKGSDQ